jgi:aminoglycoside phosphotransferase (APT) family kinase protein
VSGPAGGTLVCHNDVELSNVVFRDGIAVALLDFEFASPGRPVYDLAQLARLCVPIEDGFDQARIGWRPADRPARLRLVADAYGLDRDGRVELLTAMNDALARIEAAARRSIDAGDPNAVAMSNRTGGIEKYDRRRRWWTVPTTTSSPPPSSDPTTSAPQPLAGGLVARRGGLGHRPRSPSTALRG